MIDFTRARGSEGWSALHALRLIAEAAMLKSGYYTDAQLRSGREHLRAEFERGGMWIASDARGPVGAIGLADSDVKFWPESADPLDPKALYISKVMAIPGSGIAGRLLEFAEFRALDTGCELLRLDCVAWNDRLRDYWKSHGFQLLHTAVGPDYEAALFEKDLR